MVDSPGAAHFLPTNTLLLSLAFSHPPLTTHHPPLDRSSHNLTQTITHRFKHFNISFNKSS